MPYYIFKLKDPAQLEQYPALLSTFDKNGRFRHGKTSRFYTDERILEGEVIRYGSEFVQEHPFETFDPYQSTAPTTEQIFEFKLRFRDIERRVGTQRDSQGRFSDGSYDDVEVTFNGSVEIVDVLLSVSYLEPSINTEENPFVDTTHRTEIVSARDTARLEMIRRVGRVGTFLMDSQYQAMQSTVETMKSRVNAGRPPLSENEKLSQLGGIVIEDV